MSKIKYSAAESFDAQQKVSDVLTDIESVSTKLKSFISAADYISRQWGTLYVNNSKIISFETDTDGVYRYYITGVPGYSAQSYRSHSEAYTELNRYITGKQDAYNFAKAQIETRVNNFLTLSTTKINSIKTLLTTIDKAIETFESTEISFSEAINEITQGTELDGSISFEQVDFNDGQIDVVMFTYTDENGNTVSMSISEALNAFYTYTGTALSSTVAYEAYLDEIGISANERDAYRTRNLMDTGAYVDKLSDNGFMKLASDNSIKGFYDNILDSYSTVYPDKEQIDRDINTAYESVLNSARDKLGSKALSDAYGELLASNVGGLVASGMAISAAVQNDKDYPLQRKINFDDEEDEDVKRLKVQQQTNEEKTQELVDQGLIEEKEEDTPVKPASISVDENPEVVEGGGDGEPEEVLPEGTEEEIVPEEVVPEDTVPEPEDGTDTEGGDGGEGGDDEGDGDGETPPPDDETVTPQSTIEEPTTEEPPSAIDDTLTNEDIDRMAEEEFYNQFDDEGLAEYRQNHIEEFDNLYENDREGLVEYLEESGYSPSEASSIADDKALGMVAFLAAKQTSDMAGISNGIAQSHNVDMSTFDTSYDNGASYQDLMDGNANAFISNPNESPKVNDAKVSMNEAKSNYNSAVSSANSSVEKANEDKEKLNNVKKEIVSKSGEDTDDWSEEDIEKYNDAVKDYNESVQKANENVNKAQEAKNAYEDSKKAYDDAKEEYYNEIKQEVQAGREDEYYNPTPEPEQPDTTPSKPQTPPDGGGVVQDDDSLGIGSETGQGDQGGNTGNVTQDDDSLGIGGAGSSVEPEPDATTQPVKPQEETQDSGGVVTNPDSLGF